MPTYEYHCSKCKGSFEMYQSMKDDPVTICPKELCQRKTWAKGAVKRQLGTGAGLIFKGTGFYQTDYRSASYQESAKKDVAPTSSGDSKPGADSKSSGDSKPAETRSAPAADKPSKTSKGD